MRFDRATLIALAGAAVFAWGCDTADNARNANNSKPPATTGTAGASGATSAAAASDADKKPAVVLTGCLQEEKGMLGNYILTQANRVAPDESVGTSGSEKANPGSEPRSKVEERQFAQASRSYRLSGESDQLKDHVGHEIRVRGNLADKSDLKDADHDVSQSDLAKVDVQSVEMIANSCTAKK